MTKKTYFQFHKEAQLPIYISLNTQEFDASMVEFLFKLKFTKMSEDDAEAMLKNVKNVKNARILHLSEASLNVAKTIDGFMPSDAYGEESILPKGGFRIYRFKKRAMMIYSFTALEWELQCFQDFSYAQNFQYSMLIINRFLSLALSVFGIVGFFGVRVNEGLVVQKKNDSKGEVVFIDLLNHRTLTLDGVGRMGARYMVMRLDATLHHRNVQMSQEELLSFLNAHHTFLDYPGPTVPVMQAIASIAKKVRGVIHPEESFRPRVELH